jgi:hypothetical protein
MPNTIPAAGEAMPISHKIQHDKPAPLVHAIDESSFQKLTMKELGAVYDGLRLAESTLCGVINQPKFIVSKTNSFNTAGALVDNLHSHLCEVIDAVVSFAKAATPKTVEEVESKAWILFKNEAYCCDDISVFVVLAAEQNLALSHAEFDAKHGGPRA